MGGSWRYNTWVTLRLSLSGRSFSSDMHPNFRIEKNNASYHNNIITCDGGGGGVFGGHRGLEIAILANIVLLKFKCFSVPAVNRDFIPI